jgi:hypothetical protein
MCATRVTDEMIAREFRLQRCSGSAMEALSNPALRRVLELGAKVRAARESNSLRPVLNDAKSRAANNNK